MSDQDQIERLRAEVAALKAERDEARCHAPIHREPEPTPAPPPPKRDLFAAESTILRAEVARVTAQRDEARQNADALREALTEAQSHAETRTAERGSDCFAEKEGGGA